MARNKEKKKKESLVHEKKVNKRAPVWVYLRTKNRGLIRGRTRHWRSGKLGKKIRKREKKEKAKTKRGRTGTKFKKVKK